MIPCGALNPRRGHVCDPPAELHPCTGLCPGLSLYGRHPRPVNGYCCSVAAVTSVAVSNTRLRPLFSRILLIHFSAISCAFGSCSRNGLLRPESPPVGGEFTEKLRRLRIIEDARRVGPTRECVDGERKHVLRLNFGRSSTIVVPWRSVPFTVAPGGPR